MPKLDLTPSSGTWKEGQLLLCIESSNPFQEFRVHKGIIYTYDKVENVCDCSKNQYINLKEFQKTPPRDLSCTICHVVVGRQIPSFYKKRFIPINEPDLKESLLEESIKEYSDRVKRELFKMHRHVENYSTGTTGFAKGFYSEELHTHLQRLKEIWKRHQTK